MLNEAPSSGSGFCPESPMPIRPYLDGQRFDPETIRVLGLAFEMARVAVCTENSIHIDYVTESPNVSGDDRSVMFLADPVRIAVQVEEPT